MPNYQYNNNSMNDLAEMLQINDSRNSNIQKMRQERQMPGIQEQAHEKLMKATSQTEQTAEQEQMNKLLGMIQSGQLPQGAGASMGKASISRQPNLGVYDLKKQQMDVSQQNKYAKGLEKYSDLTGAAADLERITNRDGKGGVFTNPDAQLISAGKVVSAVPDSALGVAEMVGAAPQGSAEERKAFARYKLSMGHALTGARMNPGMQKMIQDSLGGMASGDPALMAKGLRGSGRIIGGTLKTVQGGFTPEVKGFVHDQGNGDPMELFGKIPSENAPPSNYNSPPPGSGKHKQPKPVAPPQAAPASDSMSGFDPDSYLRGSK